MHTTLKMGNLKQSLRAVDFYSIFILAGSISTSKAMEHERHKCFLFLQEEVK